MLFRSLNIVPTPEAFKRSVARCEALGWFIKIHGSAEDLLDIAPMLRTLKINAVIDHLAYPNFDLPVDQPHIRVVQELLKQGNWWLMLSNGDRWSKTGYPWDDAVKYARAFIDTAPDRMIWGSDWPHPLVTEDMEMKNDGDVLELLYRYASSEAIKHKILVDNPAKLFGFNS